MSFMTVRSKLVFLCQLCRVFFNECHSMVLWMVHCNGDLLGHVMRLGGSIPWLRAVELRGVGWGFWLPNSEGSLLGFMQVLHVAHARVL